MQMKSIKAFLVGTIAIISVLAFARSEPNAFLDQNVKNHAELMKQIRTNDEVMSRYMRHFGMTRQEVLDFFGSLKIDELEQDGVYLVYNVPETGEIRAKAIFYKKGTKVWVDQNGGLVLKASCGNPMLVGTDRQGVSVSPTSGPYVEAVRPVTVPETVATTASPAIIPMEVESSALIFPSSPPAEIMTLAPPASFNPAILLPFIAVPLAFETPNEPIPEPATMVGLCAGIGLVIARRKKRRATR